jgi:hypothetical protein
MEGRQFTNVDALCSVLNQKLDKLPKHTFLIWLCNDTVNLSDLYRIVGCVAIKGWANIDVEMMIPGEPGEARRSVRFSVTSLDSKPLKDLKGRASVPHMLSSGSTPRPATNEMTR